MKFIGWLLAIIAICITWQTLSRPALAANYGYSRFSNTTVSGDGCTYIVIDKIVNETGALISSASVTSTSEIRLYDYSQSGLNPADDFPLQNVTYGKSYNVTCWPTLGRFDFYVGTTSGQFLSGSTMATAGRVNHFTLILTSSFASNGIVGLGAPTVVDRPRYLDLYDITRGLYYWDPCPAHTKGSYPGYTTKNISWGINTRGFSGSTIQELDDFGTWYYPDPNDPDYSWMKWGGQGNQMGWVMGLGGESHYYPNAPIGMSPSTYYPDQSVYPLPPQKLAVAKDGVYYYDNITYVDSLSNGNTSSRPYGVCYELLTDLRASSAGLQSYTQDSNGNILAGTPVKYGANIHNYSGTITSRNYTYPLLRLIRSDGAQIDPTTPQQGSISPGGDAGISHTWTAQPGTYYIQACADYIGPQYEAQPLGGRCFASGWFTVEGPPGAPSSLQATNVQCTRVDLSWSAVPGATSYTVTVSPGGSVNLPGTSTTFTLTEPPSNTAPNDHTDRTWTVMANNGAGSSNPPTSGPPFTNYRCRHFSLLQNSNLGSMRPGGAAVTTAGLVNPLSNSSSWIPASPPPGTVTLAAPVVYQGSSCSGTVATGNFTMSYNTSSYSYGGTVPQLTVSASSTAPLGTYTACYSASVNPGNMFNDTPGGVGWVTFVVRYPAMIQVGSSGGGNVFTGDIHSNGAINFDNSAGQPMHHFFADGVAGVVSSAVSPAVFASDGVATGQVAPPPATYTLTATANGNTYSTGGQTQSGQVAITYSTGATGWGGLQMMSTYWCAVTGKICMTPPVGPYTNKSPSAYNMQLGYSPGYTSSAPTNASSGHLSDTILFGPTTAMSLGTYTFNIRETLVSDPTKYCDILIKFTVGTSGTFTPQSQGSCSITVTVGGPAGPMNNWVISPYPAAVPPATAGVIKPSTVKSDLATLAANAIKAGGVKQSIVGAPISSLSGYCDSTHKTARLLPLSGSVITLSGWNNSINPCTAVIIGKEDGSSPVDLDIASDVVAGANHAVNPVTFLISGSLKIEPSVATIDGIYIWQNTFDDSLSSTALTINGSLANIGSTGSQGFIDGLLNSGFKRDVSSLTSPSEIINFQPQYLDIFTSILGSSAYSWSEH